jgi:hypothetical protein
MLERDIERKVAAVAEDMGMYTDHIKATGKRGFPDRIFITKGGYIFFMEFKTTSGSLSARQEYVINKMENNNTDVSVVRNVADGVALLKSKRDCVQLFDFKGL